MSEVQTITPRNIDSILIQELNELSLNAREKTMEEIHGAHAQSVAQQEQPEKLEEALKKMRRELEHWPSPDDKRAYDIAVETDPRYVCHDKFFLRFLRAEEYDAHQAVFRMLKFMEFNKENLGSQVLTRPICQSDLTPAAIRIMKEEGILQILPFRDSSGRRIAVFLGVGEVGTSFPEMERVRPIVDSTPILMCCF
jgi:hypothetical protein